MGSAYNAEWNTKSDAELKALTPSPFVYFISSHINSRVVYLAIAVACATVRLNTCSLAWPVYRPGYDPGPVRES